MPVAAAPVETVLPKDGAEAAPEVERLAAPPRGPVRPRLPAPRRLPAPNDVGAPAEPANDPPAPTPSGPAQEPVAKAELIRIEKTTVFFTIAPSKRVCGSKAGQAKQHRQAQSE